MLFLQNKEEFKRQHPDGVDDDADDHDDDLRIGGCYSKSNPLMLCLC